MMITNRDKHIRSNLRRRPRSKGRINLTLIKINLMKKIMAMRTSLLLEVLLQHMLKSFRIKRISLKWANKPLQEAQRVALEKSFQMKMLKQQWLL